MRSLTNSVTDQTWYVSPMYPSIQPNQIFFQFIFRICIFVIIDWLSTQKSYFISAICLTRKCYTKLIDWSLPYVISKQAIFSKSEKHFQSFNAFAFAVSTAAAVGFIFVAGLIFRRRRQSDHCPAALFCDPTRHCTAKQKDALNRNLLYNFFGRNSRFIFSL